MGDNERSSEPGSKPKMSNHVQEAYRDAVYNIAESKRQQWMILNYTLIVYAAIYGLDRALSPSPRERFVLLLIAVIDLFYSLIFLSLSQKMMTKLRTRLRWIYKQYFADHEIKGLDLPTHQREFWYEPYILISFYVISCVGFAIVVYVLVVHPSLLAGGSRENILVFEGCAVQCSDAFCGTSSILPIRLG
jgi:hypothetical protein